MGFWTKGRAVATLTSLLLSCASGLQAQNVLQNPGFTGGLGGWTPLTSPDYTVGWDAAQGNGAAGSVSVDVPSSASPEIYILSQCAPAAPSTLYNISGSFRYPGSVATIPRGGLVVRSFTDALCTAPVGAVSGFGLSFGGSPADTWGSPTYVKGYMTPATAIAVQVLLRVNTTASGAFSGWFDDISIVPSSFQYFTVAPCRLVDTRDQGAPIGGPVLAGQETRTFTASGSCGIPSTANALSVNVAVTQPTSAGNLRLFPSGDAVPNTATINYSAGQTRANNAIVRLTFPGSTLAVFVAQQVGTSVHLILDVNGYFE
jgi:hypothetical protein